MRKKAQDHKAGRQAAEPVPRMRIAQLEGEQADLEAALKRAKQRIAQLEGEQEARIAKLEAEEEGALEAELAEQIAEILRAHPCSAKDVTLCKLCERYLLRLLENWAVTVGRAPPPPRREHSPACQKATPRRPQEARSRRGVLSSYPPLESVY